MAALSRMSGRNRRSVLISHACCGRGDAFEMVSIILLSSIERVPALIHGNYARARFNRLMHGFYPVARMMLAALVANSSISFSEIIKG
ncbi:MAG TPA: hypothetical protein PKJ64_08575, partial [bacterium]|nr:hypothetical protein [bacterium]